MNLFGGKKAKEEKVQTIQAPEQAPAPEPEPARKTQLQIAEEALQQAQNVQGELERAAHEARSEADRLYASVQTCQRALTTATTTDEIRTLIADQEAARRDLENATQLVRNIQDLQRKQEGKVKEAELEVERIRREAAQQISFIRGRMAHIAQYNQHIAARERDIENMRATQAQDRLYMKGNAERLLELTGETVEGSDQA